MRRLVIGCSVLLDPHFRVMYDEVESAFLDGEDVVFASCGGGCRACVSNPHAGRIQCICCSTMCRWLERRFRNRIKVVHFPKMPTSDRRFEFEDVKQLKDIVYKGVNIGYAAFSEYVSLTRDLLENLTEEKKRYMAYLLGAACGYVDVAEKLINDYAPDSVSVYNGRMFETRPFFELARLKGIPVKINEVITVQLDADTIEFRHLDFCNCFPQDVDGYAAKVRECWSRSKLSDADKRCAASEFFNKRRNGVAAGDAVGSAHNGVFVKKQVKGLLPEGFDATKHNVVIFNSSEDELCSIDKDFESHALFLSHIEGVKTVARILADHPDYHVYLRIHPNLTGVNQPYHLLLHDLPKEPGNLTVLPADSKYSTYDLMDAAEKVVVLGSTAGVESTYWRRPVILIGSAMYYQLDVAYKPKDAGELSKLLLTQGLQPKPIDDALKYAYYVTRNSELGTPSRVVDLRSIRKRFHGNPRWVPTWRSLYIMWWVLDANLFNAVRMMIRGLARNVLPIAKSEKCSAG